MVKQIKQEKINNSMQQLVAGVVPTSQGGVSTTSPNAINAIETLACNVRAGWITLNYSLLTFVYSQFGLIQSMIETPVLDAFRGGIPFSAYEKQVVDPKKKKHSKWFSIFNAADNKQQQKADPAIDFNMEQVKRREDWEKEQVALDEKLRKADDSYFREEISGEDLRRLQIFLRREQIFEKLKQAIYWKRLFGGAAIVVLDGRDPKTELKLEDINQDTDLEFYVTDNWEISNSDAGSRSLNEVNWLSDVPFNLKGHPVHKSRVITLKGKEFPPLYRAIGRGWGMSILEPLVRTLNKGIKNENVIFELLDEAKVDVYQFAGFNDAMQDEDATNAVMKRVNNANALKNYLGGVLMDSEDEYKQKQIQFGGMADLKEDSRVDQASDARIPMNKLFGTSPAGFNSGDSDRESYADQVESEIRTPAEPAVLKLLEICGRKVLGKTLDFEINWAPMIRSTPYDDEKRKTLILANLNEASMWGRITNKEWQKGVNKYNLLGVDISYKDRFVADPMAKNVFKPGFGGK